MRGLKSTSVGLDAAKVKPPAFSNCCTSLSNFSAAAFGVSGPLSCFQWGEMSCQTRKQQRNTYSARLARGSDRATSRAQPDTRICRAGTPPSAPQPQFGSRRTDRSNSVWFTADKRETINTRASEEEAGMGIKIITAAVRDARHPRVRGSAGKTGSTCSRQPLQLERAFHRTGNPSLIYKNMNVPYIHIYLNIYIGYDGSESKRDYDGWRRARRALFGRKHMDPMTESEKNEQPYKNRCSLIIVTNSPFAQMPNLLMNPGCVRERKCVMLSTVQ